MTNNPKRLLIFIVAYQAEKTIQSVLSRIPISLLEEYEIEVLAIDDASQDNTYQIGKKVRDSNELPFKITVLRNPKNQGYGGNQKIGYQYALQNGFDLVALIHGDGQYAPECLPQLLSAFDDGKYSAVFGSRMMLGRNALKGGMPIYKYIGNRILTAIENFLLKTHLSEFHSGYRIYRVQALEKIPFQLNTKDFHFDTEIIVQLVAAGLLIKELPIPTYYGDEICRVNGMRYAKDVIKTVLHYRAQSLGILFDPRFDVQNASNLSDKELDPYQIKTHGTTTHTVALHSIATHSKVLDIGCAAGYFGVLLQEKKFCKVTGVDLYVSPMQNELDGFVRHDLFDGPPLLNYGNYECITLMDVIEHLPNPEGFASKLHELLEKHPSAKIIVSTGNVAFILVRLMLLMGWFNYGKRGILDRTHTRLFTCSSIQKLWTQAGFTINKIEGIPIPFSLIFKSTKLIDMFDAINRGLIWISMGLFAYQIYLEITPNPNVNTLLRNAIDHSREA